MNDESVANRVGFGLDVRVVRTYSMSVWCDSTTVCSGTKSVELLVDLDGTWKVPLCIDPRQCSDDQMLR